MTPYTPALSSQILDFINVDHDKRQLKYCKIELFEGKTLNFNLEVKKEVFMTKVLKEADEDIAVKI